MVQLKKENLKFIKKNIEFEKVYLGKFPIMLQSNMCLEWYEF